ncbi:procathepsin L-like [Vanessa tameamea]|uniref:Procathepsin L-like n=1 Tax=Vanessa tameamea TaxID=334116 RepID=A0A8B8HYE4_VANTA
MCYIGLIVLFVVNSVLAKNILRYNLEDASKHFETFRRTYNKEYDGTEKALRFEIFVKNLEKINELNEGSDSPVFGITQFSDLTSEEFVQMYSGYKSDNRTAYLIDRSAMEEHYIARDIPESFDWRDKKVVGEVKNQGQCQCCWAFAVTGNLESAYAIKHNQSVRLSEQQLVDCDKMCSGCNGGNVGVACEYLRQCGSMTEDKYPYEERDNVCRYNSTNIRVKVKSCRAIQVTEDELAYQLYSIGPLMIGVNSEKLQPYRGGLLTDCKAGEINHAILLVGYGTDEDGNKYWLAKNSWGTVFGEHGYLRMLRGVNCLNLMAEPAITAVVE